MTHQNVYSVASTFSFGEYHIKRLKTVIKWSIVRVEYAIHVRGMQTNSCPSSCSLYSYLFFCIFSRTREL